MPRHEAVTTRAGLISLGVVPAVAEVGILNLPSMLEGRALKAEEIIESILDHVQRKLGTTDPQLEHLDYHGRWVPILCINDLQGIAGEHLRPVLKSAASVFESTRLTHMHLHFYEGLPSRRIAGKELFPISWLMNFEVGVETNLGDGVVSYNESSGQWTPSQKKGRYTHASRLLVRQLKS